MKSKGTIFKQTYEDYLELIKDKDLEDISRKLGAKFENDEIIIKLFNDEYSVSAEGISDFSNQKPSYDICVILSKYILLCPDTPPGNHDWFSYKDFRNSAPLVNYFRNEVEDVIGSHFSGKLNVLRKASELLAGYPPSVNVNYDFAVQFNALPLIPIILLYNDPDEEFPANCSLLFDSQSENYLDCECLAMLGRQLCTQLVNTT